MTSVPVLWAEQFHFLVRVMFGDFCANGFKLGSDNPPISQTLSQKKVVVKVFKNLWGKFILALDFIMSALLTDTQRQLRVCSGGCKNCISKT